MRPTGCVRPLEKNDVPRVAELHSRVFVGSEASLAGTLTDHLTEIFYRHPCQDDDLPSLVYEEPDGSITGCLGVIPRPMAMNGSPIRAAICHNFMVAPGAHSALAALHLLKTFWRGPQDLSVAEANQAARNIWKGAGGTTALAYCFPGSQALTTVTKSVVIAPGNTGTVTATCPKGKGVLFGGVRSQHYGTGGGELQLSSMARAGKRGWKVGALKFGNIVGRLTSVAYCG